MADQGQVTPIKIQQVDDVTLSVKWQDGHESRYRGDYLRGRCPCAVCVDEWTGKRTIGSDQIQPDVHPEEIEAVGRYGIRVRWSDGHGTGIYTFDFLRSLCPCCRCLKQ